MTSPVREAKAKDLQHFIDAGKKYADRVGFEFDESIYVDSLASILSQPNVKAFVYRGHAHCVIMLMPSIYGDQVVAKVMSTWGRGGTKCFKKALQWAKENGADIVVADAPQKSPILKTYEDMNMDMFDLNYMGAL